MLLSIPARSLLMLLFTNVPVSAKEAAVITTIIDLSSCKMGFRFAKMKIVESHSFVRKPVLITALAMILLLAGCATTKDLKVSKFAPRPVLGQPVEYVDIISAITGGEKNQESSTATEKNSKELDGALKRFADSVHYDSESEGEKNKKSIAERNRIQDRVLMASNALCEDYKVVLKRKQAHVNFWSGAAAIVFGAAGGVVGGERAAQNLSALSAISSGVRAEYNEDFYSSYTAHLIANGIELRRKSILCRIQIARKNPPDEYTLEAALADAITYHGACSLIGGLGQIDAALNKMSNTNAGLDALFASKFYKKSLHSQSEPAASTSQTGQTGQTAGVVANKPAGQAAVAASQSANTQSAAGNKPESDDQESCIENG